MKKKFIGTLAAGAALAALLTGCTAEAGVTDNKPTTTPTATTGSSGQADDVCVNGIAFMDLGGGAEKTLKGSCETVIVIGDKGTLHVGDIETLSLMGNGNTITAGKIAKIDKSANDNTITYTGSAPKEVGDGTGNTITAK